MRNSKIRRASAALVILCASITLTSCLEELFGNGPGKQDCGAEHNDTFSRDSLSLFSGGDVSEGVEGNDRVYTWSKSFANVCTKAEEATYAQFIISYSLKAFDHTVPFQGQGRVFQNYFFSPYSEYLAENHNSGIVTQQSVIVENIGLQQVYGEGPGEMYVELQVKYPKTSDAAFDRAQFNTWVSHLEFTTHWYTYLAPTTN